MSLLRDSVVRCLPGWAKIHLCRRESLVVRDEGLSPWNGLLKSFQGLATIIADLSRVGFFGFGVRRF